MQFPAKIVARTRVRPPGAIVQRGIGEDGVRVGRFDMPTRYEYPTHTEETEWTLPALGEAAFTWDYDVGSDELLKLSARAKGAQWDAESRIDWTLSVDPDDPMQLDERVLPLHGTALWAGLRASSARRSATTARSSTCRSSCMANRGRCCVRRGSSRMCRGSNRSSTPPPR
jgi:hypothetical protein